MATQKILILDGTTGLAKELTPNTSSSGAADAGKVIALDNGGKLPSSMLPAGAGGGSTDIEAAESLSAGAIVNVDSTGKARNADASDATKPAVGFVTSAVASAATATVYFPGQMITGVTGLTAGSPVFLSTTAGGITSTAPSGSGELVQLLSPAALSATEFIFQPTAGIIRG